MPLLIVGTTITIHSLLFLTSWENYSTSESAFEAKNAYKTMVGKLPRWVFCGNMD